MLVLSRRLGEEIVINGNIRVTVVGVKGDRVRLGIVAPDNVPVDRATMNAYMRDAALKVPQPEIHVSPNRLAKYDAVARVLADAQRLGATHIGFTGIDQYN